MFVFGSSPPRNLAAGAIRKEYNHTFETALTLCIDQKILVNALAFSKDDFCVDAYSTWFVNFKETAGTSCMY